MQNNCKQLVQYSEPEDPLQMDMNNDSDNFNLVQMLKTIEKENLHLSQVNKNSGTTTTMQRSTIKKSLQITIFQNCHMGSISEIYFHIHKGYIEPTMTQNLT